MWDTGPQGNWGGTMWTVSLMPYVMKIGDSGGEIVNGALQGRGNLYTCPSIKFTTSSEGASVTDGIAYGYNSGMLTTGWRTIGPGSGTGSTLYGFPGVAQASLYAPANLVAFADSAIMSPAEDPNIYNGGGACTGYEGGNGAGTGDCGPYTMQPLKWKAQRTAGWEFNVPGTGNGDYTSTGGNRRRRPHFRHMEKANVVFADGHAKAVGPNTYQARLGTPDDIWHNHN
jgi:prepilin-type processing-associated H-X9-DG protein